MSNSSTMDSLSNAGSGHVTIGSLPNTPQRVLNSKQPAYAIFDKAWNDGLLNPNQNASGGRYNSITTAYVNLCTLSSNYYTIRK